MLQKIKNLVVKEEGQALTEYGLIIALIAMAVVAALGFLGDEIIAVFEDIVEDMGATGTGDSAVE